MFEQELKDFILLEISAGRIINADITGVDEQKLTAEGLGYMLNQLTNEVQEMFFFFLKKDGVISYYPLNKLQQ